MQQKYFIAIISIVFQIVSHINCLINLPQVITQKADKIDLPKEKFFKQNLNHFDHTDERTWLQVNLQKHISINFNFNFYAPQ